MKSINRYLKIHSKTFYWVLFSLILLVLIIIQYYGVVHFHYPDTPGDDTLNHWGMIQDIKNNSKGFFEVIRSGGYPPLYHFSILKLASLFNQPEMTIMLWTYPAIIVFASLAAFLLAYAVFKNKWIALLALVLYAFSTRTPLQLLHDGGYPNLIAAHILLPSAIAFLILAWNNSYKGKKIMFYALSGIFVILTMLTHHISTFEMLGLAIAATPVLIITTWIKNKWQWWKGIIFFTFYLLLIIFLGYLYFKSPVFAPFRGLASFMIEVTNKFPFIKGLIKPEGAALVPWQLLPGRIGRLVVPLALVFIPLFAFFKPLRERKMFYPVILVSVWSVMLLILSQSTLFTNPERLARDSAMPLSILAAGCIYYIGQYLSKQKLLFGAFVAVCIFLAYSPVHDRLYNAFHYEPMVRVTQADLQAIDMLKSREPATILINGWSQFIDKHMREWQIAHTDFASIELKNAAKNPAALSSKELLKPYQYIYIIDSQLGWAPGTEFGYAKNYLNNDCFLLLGEFAGPSNHVYLFENLSYGK